MEEEWIPLQLTHKKIDTTGLGFNVKNKAVLRSDLISCCKWIVVTEAHCRLADLHIPPLEVELATAKEEIERLSSALREKERIFDEQISSKDDWIRTLETNRQVPSSLTHTNFTNPLLTNGDDDTQTLLQTLSDKNDQLATLERQKIDSQIQMPEDSV